jgi:hypothetical protein
MDDTTTFSTILSFPSTTTLIPNLFALFHSDSKISSAIRFLMQFSTHALPETRCPVLLARHAARPEW